MTQGQVPWLMALLLALALPHHAYVAAAAFDAWGGSAARWHYVLQGAGDVLLWVTVAGLWRHRAVQAVCLLGVFESGLKAGCGLVRLHEVVFAPGGSVCQAGERWTALGSLCALFVCLGVRHAAKAARAG